MSYWLEIRCSRQSDNGCVSMRRIALAGVVMTILARQWAEDAGEPLQ